VTVEFGIDGNLVVLIRAAASPGLLIERAETIALRLQSLELGTVDGVGHVTLSGAVKPLLMSNQGMNWPELEVKDLRISSDGRISISEAWLNVEQPVALDLWGFQLELARLGIGMDDPRQRMWLDLSGSLRLMDQLPVGLGIEGFKISWPQDVAQLLRDHPDPLEFALEVSKQVEVSFAGVELFYGMPGAVEFTGLIRFFKDAQIVGFSGDMALRVPASGFAAEAGLLIGFNNENPPYPFLYLYFGVDLPAGIPLGQSGLALKAAMGMFGINVVPDKSAEQNWYYDWYKRGPIVGAHPTNKWKPGRDALALGVGVTITTADGYVKGTRGLLVLSLPGPVLMIEGRALLLNGLSPNSEPPLRALAVFDGKEGTVQFNVEAEAELVKDVVEAYAMTEAFFDFNDLTRWHLYLGQDQPADRRVRANILQLGNAFLFKADVYFMLDMVGAETLRSRMGVFVGFKPPIPDIGPVKVELDASLEGKGEVTVRPEQFSGEISLEGTVRLSAFDFGIQVGARAELMTEGPLPFEVKTDVEIRADLPWPCDPVEATVHFEWSLQAPPQIVAPLFQVSLGSRFSSNGVALSADGSEPGTKLYDANPVSKWKTRAEASPVVAMDSHVILEFTHEMNAEQFARHPDGEEKYFDAGYFHFVPSLTSIQVFECKKNVDGTVPDRADAWTMVAEAGNADRQLPGIWTAGSEPGRPEAPSARRLQLWTDNPLLHTHAASGMAVATLLGTVPAGKPLAGRILDDYPDLIRPRPRDPKRNCVTFGKWAGHTKPAGEVVKTRGVTLWAKNGSVTFPTVEDRCHASRLEDVPLAMMLAARFALGQSHPELVGTVSLAEWRAWATKQKPESQADLERSYPEFTPFWEALFPQSKTCVCLTPAEDVEIHFPEAVSEAIIQFCRPQKLPDARERAKATARTGIDNVENAGKYLQESGDSQSLQAWKAFLAKVESVRRNPLAKKDAEMKWHQLAREARSIFAGLGDEPACIRDVPISITGGECQWKINSAHDEAFSCLTLVGFKGLAICKVCWVAKSDKDQAERSRKQAETNSTFAVGTLEHSFRPDCCYRVVVGTEVARSILAPPGLEEFFGEITAMLDAALGISGNKRAFAQTAFFQTKSPPANLRPYVRSVFPDSGFLRHFPSEKVSLRFLRPHLSTMFADPVRNSIGLKLAARDPSGKVVFSSKCEWGKAPEATLFPEEEIWRDHRDALGWMAATSQFRDDVLTAEFQGEGHKLAAKTRYELLLVDEDVHHIDQDTPIFFQGRFVTSAFDTFQHLAGKESTVPNDSTESPQIISFDAHFPLESNRFLAASQAYAAACAALADAELDHRFDCLEEGRAGLEKARLLVRDKQAAMEDAFQSPAMAISQARLFGKPAGALEMALLRSTHAHGIVGVWFTAPESLNLQIDAGDGRTVGRTTWELMKDRTHIGEAEIDGFFDTGNRHLLILMRATPMRSGDYSVKLIRHFEVDRQEWDIKFVVP
jgi:hypothetical protein